MNKTNWKEYLNTILLSIVTYFLIDIHLTFKTIVKDVEYLKETVKLHEFRLNSENGDNNKKPFIYSDKISKAILPNQDTKVKKSNDKTKFSPT